MVKSLQDLRQLLELLTEKGVVAFSHDGLELTLSPSFATGERAFEDSDDEPGWKGLSREEQALLGVS